jgi:soluble P-type ATPase
MIAIEIPGWGNLEIENIIFDLNGTLARDGELIPGVKDKIRILSQMARIYILTADIHGSAESILQDVKAEWVRVTGEDSKSGKRNFLQSLKPEATVAVGNGNNDQSMLKECALGIVVLGEEGLSLAAMKDADLMVKDISDALDLLLKPKRLIATLRG